MARYGKTSLAMNMADQCAIHEKLSVLVISLEMRADELKAQLDGSVGRIEQTNHATTQLADH